MLLTAGLVLQPYNTMAFKLDTHQQKANRVHKPPMKVLCMIMLTMTRNEFVSLRRTVLVLRTQTVHIQPKGWLMGSGP